MKSPFGPDSPVPHQPLVTGSAEHASAAFDQAPFGYFVLDGDWRYVYSNAAGSSLTFRRVEELVGKIIWDVFPEAVGSSFWLLYHRVMSSRVLERMTDFYAPLQRWYEVSVFPTTMGIGVSFHDVTAAQEAERALRLSEARLRLVLDASTAGYWDFDQQHDVFLASARMLTLFGLSETERPTRDELLSLVHLEDRGPVAVVLAGGDAAENRWSAALRVRSIADSTERWIRMRSQIIADLEGRPTRIVGVVVDVTEKIRARTSLVELQRQLEEAQALAAIGSWSWDVVTGEVVWSAETYRLLEVEPGTELSFDLVLAMAIDDAQRQKFLQQTQDALAGVRPYDFEASVRRKDGSIRTVHNLGRVERTADGAPRRMTGLMQDITAAKLAAEERSRLEAQIQQSQKLESLGILAGGIAHDFNNLLVGVLTNASGLLHDVPLDHAWRAPVAEIEHAAQRAADLTRQLLAYSGRAKFVVESIDLSALAREMSQLMRAALGAGAQLDLQLASELPNVKVDTTQLRQVVMNLITNASDALEGRPGRITLRTGTASAGTPPPDGVVFGEMPVDGPRVVLEVSDSGVGMSRETLDRIFDPFFTTKFMGRGLGLAATLGIIRGHGGAISVATSPGGGTTFLLYLPADASEAAKAPMPSPLGGTDSVATRLAHEVTVLVVDDEPGVGRVIERSLQVLGYRTVLASSGHEALALLAGGFVPHLVLLDLTMPEMSGRDVLRALPSCDPPLRVVLMSGYSDQEFARDVGDFGLRGFLQKPFTISELSSMVRHALR